MEIIQGKSAIATPPKQKGLFGIHQLIATKRKSIPGRHIFIDAYCGSGLNHVNGEDIDGSPLTILGSVAKSIQSFRKVPHVYQPAFIFSDITSDRSLVQLPQNVMAWQAQVGLPVDKDFLIVENDHGTYHMPIHYVSESADQLLCRIKAHLSSAPGTTLTITIDPNGPKAIPYETLKELWRQYGRRITLVFHISATVLKRCAGAKATGMHFVPMPDHVSGLVDLFMTTPGGWIREPIGADQWTLLMLTHYEPRDPWAGQGFHKLSTDEGRGILVGMSLTNKQKRSD